MVGVFSRSFSFPNKLNPSRPSKPPISHHTRSVSLPCRSHPLISHLSHETAALKSWSLSNPESRTSDWLCDGLNRLRDLHDSLADLLQISQNRESLCRHPDLVEILLDDFLKFVDAYCIFRSAVLAFKEDLTATQVAIRRRDSIRTTLYIRSRDNFVKEINKLATAVRSIAVPPTHAWLTVCDAELAGVVSDVIGVTALVSTTFLTSISSSFSSRRPSCMGLALSKTAKKGEKAGIEEFERIGGAETVKKTMKEEEIKAVLEKMRELESCIGRIENCSERVFRGLIKSEVSLLNALTDG